MRPIELTHSQTQERLREVGRALERLPADADPASRHALEDEREALHVQRKQLEADAKWAADREWAELVAIARSVRSLNVD